MVDVIKHIARQTSITNQIREMPVFEEIPDKLLGHYSKLGSSISLVLSGFKCEKCHTEKNLTWHHLISRGNKEVLDKKKYFIQRHFYANIVVLCADCHTKYNIKNERIFGMLYDSLPPELQGMKTISEEKIEKLKKRYGNGEKL